MTCIYSRRQCMGIVSVTLLLACCLVGCQSVPSAVSPTSRPVFSRTPAPLTLPAATPTPAPGTSLGDPLATVMGFAGILPDAETLSLFDYDMSTPLDVQMEFTTELDDYTVHEMTYASPKGGRVPATLLIPNESPGPFAGIILMHGLPGNRSDNALFARGLVETGAILLMIDAPFARPENRNRIGGPLTFDETDRLEQIQLMVDLRRGVDLLVEREDVDPERLAYIGYSYGAAMGGLLAGIEPRIKAFGLMAGDGGLVSHFTDSGSSPPGWMNNLTSEEWEAWLELMEPIEPIRFVGRAAPGSLFFQNALKDQAVARDDALLYQSAGSEPKRVEWYESDHFLPNEAFRRMADWLGSKIGIDASRLAGFED